MPVLKNATQQGATEKSLILSVGYRYWNKDRIDHTSMTDIFVPKKVTKRTRQGFDVPAFILEDREKRIAEKYSHRLVEIMTVVEHEE